MKKHSIILFTIVSYFGYSQCEDSDKLDFGGTYLSKSNNYIRFEEKFKDTVYLENIAYPEDINKIKSFSDYILLKAEKYIINRGGNDFYNNLKNNGFEVNFQDSVKINYEDQKLYNLENYNVTYSIFYTYKNKNTRYAFGLEFDKNGEMISENQFPKYSENIEFENLSNYCNALEVVKKDKRFKGKTVDCIKLAYLDNINSFCWLIEEKRKPNKELEKWEKQSVNQYYVNANTNELENVIEKKSLVIACGFRTISKKEIRKEKRKKRKTKKDIK